MQGIGWLFNRDHSTIVHGLGAIEGTLQASWYNEYKDHYAVLNHGMKRPTFPNYAIEDFYAKYNVVKIESRKRTRKKKMLRDFKA